MRLSVVLWLAFGLLYVGHGQDETTRKEAASAETGLQVGEQAPAFTFRDQFGQTGSSTTLRGPNGTVLLFFRSADWWPFCKAQLVQLQSAKIKFTQRGFAVAAISYDSRAILKDFADRHKIDFPLLADPNSDIIRMFKVLNAEAVGKEKGMAHPGFFYVDATGVMREKYFEAKETDRLTPNNVVGKLFPELMQEVTENVDAPHLKLTLEQSDRDVISGNRVSLIADIELPPAVHVYAPGVQGYRPIALKLKPVSGVEFSPAIYPRPKILYLEAIQEHVPVFEGKFRISQDVKLTVSTTREVVRSLVSAERTIAIAGELTYQACDDKVCYPPSSVPVSWNLRVLPLDLKRSPDRIQHH